MPASRILDAAGELFAARGIAAVDIKDIARAAGCSRATLYRYFENRDALHTAYVHREARAIGARLAESIDAIDDPRERLLEAMTQALRLVRENPSLAAWFARTPIGAVAAGQSQVVQAMAADFLVSLGPGDRGTADRRARWMIRVMTSLLTVPGRDPEDERAMLAEFVIPLVGPISLRTLRSAPG